MTSVSVHCTDEKETAKLASRLAGIARRGDTFALYGTLGMGKSVFARGFIQALTGAREVPSPTFTLVQGYEAPDFEICHYDLYRIKSAEEVFELGMEEALYENVCLIEWPEKMGALLPEDIFKVSIENDGQGRLIKISSDSPEKKKRLAALEF